MQVGSVNEKFQIVNQFFLLILQDSFLRTINAQCWLFVETVLAEQHRK